MSSGKIEGNYLKNVQNSLIIDESAIFNDYYLQKSINSEPKQTYEGVIDNHLRMIKEIHIILKNSQDLTQKQKYAYCNSQRFYMKLYLKRISKKR